MRKTVRKQKMNKNKNVSNEKRGKIEKDDVVKSITSQATEENAKSEAMAAHEQASAAIAEYVEEDTTVTEESEKLRVLIAASEGMPFITTGGLGEVIGSLPKAIMKENSQHFDVRVILPLYESISDEERQKMQFICHFDVELGWRKQYCGIFRTEKNGVTYYFIDNEYYFKRSNAYGYIDDGERFAFFSKAVLDSIYFLEFQPQIIHCHDWQTALIPVYLHYHYHHLNTKSIFTIHNIEYQGKYGFEIVEDVMGLSPNAKELLEYHGCVNLMKAAIECSHQVNTVSPTYACELRENYYAKGLAKIIRKNEFKMRGILNGIDVESYNPETDASLFANYSKESIEKKKINKVELQRLVNLPVDENIPVIALVSRLVTHKGLDLITRIMEQLLNERVQVVVLGIGERQYEDYFKWLQGQYQGKVASLLCFNSDLARKVYAGSDFFLMPSKSEPCGLAQMIASRYGTVPIVRATGGLRDTIKDCTNGEGNGFTFEHYNAHDLLNAMHRGLHLYKNEEQWKLLVEWIMTLDFSWEKSAREYEKLYVETASVQIPC